VSARIEHSNITVQDPDALAALLCNIFDWKIRWSGAAIDDGYTVHVGDDNTYLALYTHDKVAATREARYTTWPSINHIGVVVTDLDAVEKRIQENGMTTHGHDDYEPGRRFYVETPFNLELEIVSY